MTGLIAVYGTSTHLQKEQCEEEDVVDLFLGLEALPVRTAVLVVIVVLRLGRGAGRVWSGLPGVVRALLLLLWAVLLLGIIALLLRIVALLGILRPWLVGAVFSVPVAGHGQGVRRADQKLVSSLEPEYVTFQCNFIQDCLSLFQGSTHAAAAVPVAR